MKTDIKLFLLTLTAFLSTLTVEGKQKVVVLAELGGQHEAFTQKGLEWLHEKAAKMDFDLIEVNDCSLLGANTISQSDLIIQLNYPPYTWSDIAAKEFEQCIDEGTVSWIGFHHASLLGEFDGYGMWQWFSDFLGGIRFQNYIAEKADGEVIVEDAGHPVMNGVNPRFIIRDDEWYTYNRSPRPNAHVLASVDEQSYSPASSVIMGDHPVIWTNLEKPSRNVYFQIGHSASLFDNPDFIRMFENAICWGLHRLMPLDKAHALEKAMTEKAILKKRPLPMEGWLHEGLGTHRAMGSVLEMSMPLHTGKRAKGPEGDADYAIYGTCAISLPLGGQDLEPYNRLSFDIRTDLDAGVANINVVLANKPSGQLGAHLVNIQNQQWEHVVYQIDELARHHVQALRLYVDLKGKNISRHDTVRYFIRNLQLEQVGQPEAWHGWQTAPDRIAYSMSGYLTEGTKTAVVASPRSRRFCLIDELTRKVVYEGQTSSMPTTLDAQLQILDFSDFKTEGTYHLECGTLSTAPFLISRNAMAGTEWKILNFIYGQRCGWEVEGIHGRCHTDVFCDHEGKHYTYGGGWHDAGDLSQQTLQTGDVTFALLEAYRKRKDMAPQLARQMLNEARHGLDQMLRCRLGNGWHASSIGLLHWTDGVVGTEDDIHSVRKQNLAFDNFLYAAYEAYAARLLGDTTLRKAAIEDFSYACGKFERDGIDTFKITMEHSYNTSDATFMAAASWSASMLYELTGDRGYAEKAAQYIVYMLDCQEREGGFAGYFYRDASRRSIIHYIHQSREQLPVQALVALCESQPLHPDFERWHHAIRLYGNYLKSIARYTQPYGMIPSGIYQTDEYLDEDGFNRLHLWAPANARDLYTRQLKEGIKIDDRHYIRRFPVWFSIFNGNEAIILASGKAAAICGNYLHDEQLLDIGREQLYWTVGKNPFCQSLIYGEGHRFPSMDNFSSGEIMGEIPVGIRSYGNTDVPYWPMTNNACYKEVWMTSAGKWLSLLAEY